MAPRRPIPDVILSNVIRPAGHNVATVSLPLYTGGPGRCAYLPGRTATHEYAMTQRLTSAAYQRMMDEGFRRSGMVIYRPVCEGCRECVPIRVPVSEFVASRSQRRVLRRNTDVDLQICQPVATDENWQLYAAYRSGQHDDSDGGDRAGFEEFLYQSPVETLEMCYRVGGRLVAVGIVDACPNALSSVYFFFDPAEARRSLGVYSALAEIEECRRRGLAYWYIGYYIRECRQMNYKAQYRPHELLGSDGCWRRPQEMSEPP
jgi:arginyl-tRNA--protein-N-Asp/Glu arginylyltransferase